MELSKERLKEIASLKDKTLSDGTVITTDAYSTVRSIEIAEMARRLLAAEDQQPVGHFVRYYDEDDETIIDQCSKNMPGAFPLYAAPQLPQQGKAVQVPEPITRNEADGWWVYKGHRVGGGCAEWYNRALEDCRAAMLTSEPVSNRDELNSPAIPDGWKLVPVDMRPEQMRSLQINTELGAYAASNLSEAYSLFREFWSIALTSAPKPEVKGD